MAWPQRLELAGALYHVTSRGDGREDIYLCDEDRRAWLETLAEVCQRCNWVCHAYCQISNHYHLVIETPDANLSKGMRQLNGVYIGAQGDYRGMVRAYQPGGLEPEVYDCRGSDVSRIHLFSKKLAGFAAAITCTLPESQTSTAAAR